MIDKKTIQKRQKQPGERSHQGFAPRHGGASRKLNLKRARFITSMKDRYGYTNEKAIVEMERLLREFSATKSSLLL